MNSHTCNDFQPKEGNKKQKSLIGNLAQVGSQLRRLGIVNLRREHGMAFCASIEKLSSLRSLNVSSIGEDEILDLQYPLSPTPRFLRTLVLGGRLEKLPDWIQSLHCLVRVDLWWSKLRGDDHPLKYLEDLPNLVRLDLVKAYEGEGLCFKARRFQRLKRLMIERLEGLRWVRVEEGSIPLLEEIWIEKCELVEEVPSGIELLTNLKEVWFAEMSTKFVRRIKGEEGDGGAAAAVDYWRVAHIPDIWVGSASADGEWIGSYLKRER